MSCKKILIVEDEPAVRQTMQEILEMQGYEVFTASNGKEGTRVLQEISPEPCVILLDLMMPEMNGWDFLDFQRNNEQLRDVPVIICSAYEESAKSIKPSAYVAKPVQLKSLLGAVKAFCA